MNIEIFEKIKEFVEKETFVKKNRLTYTTDVEKDLGLTGSDATEFIIAFGKKFNVDVSHFMAADYFEAEGMNWLIPKSRQSKILTLGHLERAIIAGKLDETVITGQT